MTTVRLTHVQKRKLEKARKLLATRRGRRVTQGEAVERLADLAIDNHAALTEREPREDRPWSDDPLTSRSIGWDFGYTDHRTIDRLLYGRR